MNTQWMVVFTSALLTITNHTLQRVPGGDNGSHSGGASPRLMCELDDNLDGGIANCDVFLDAGSGIGTSSAYFAHQYPNLRVVGIETAEDRIETAQQLFEIAGMSDRVEFVNGSFVNDIVWRDRVLRRGNERVCVWLNAENYDKVDGLLLAFEQLAESLMVRSGSLIISTKRLFMGRTRRIVKEGCPFSQRIITITLRKWDLSWKPAGEDLPIFVYKRKSDNEMGGRHNMVVAILM